jgi:hypothetical protein
MPHYLCKEKYRLELHWDSIDYRNDEEAALREAYFSGPVLNNAAKIEAPDFIDLDFTPQMLTLLDSYYIVRLSWERVQYAPDGRVLLLGAVLSNNVLKTIHKFEEGDFILINTEKHEEKTHPYNLVYEAQAMKAGKEPHRYNG